MGITSSIESLSQIIGPIIGGFLLSLSINPIYGILLSAISIIPFLISFKILKFGYDNRKKSDTPIETSKPLTISPSEKTE